jgi:ribonuclease-3
VPGGERKKELQLFQKHAQIRFKSPSLLNLAFSHRSFANESAGEVDNNEKLEFFGDSVLGLVVSEYLMIALPDKSEGDMAKIKSHLRVDNFILIGKGEEYSGGRSKKALIADAVEAVIGAYYLDSGFKAVRTFIRNLLIPQINAVLEDRHKKDYKTLLQEYVQKRFKSYPRYRIIHRKGPDHNRTFWIEVSFGKRTYGPGTGKNKKEAEQQAAGIAYKALTERQKGRQSSRSRSS